MMLGLQCLRVKVPVEVGIVDGQWAELLKGEITETDRLLIPKRKGARVMGT